VTAPPSPFQDSLAIEPAIRSRPNPGDADYESVKNHRGDSMSRRSIARSSVDALIQVNRIEPKVLRLGGVYLRSAQSPA
jgi:hypothetical protein